MIQKIFHINIVGLLLFSSLIPLAQTLPNKDIDQAYEIAYNDERVQDILNKFPDIHLEANFSNQYNLWIIELLYGDRGEVGLVTVSLQKNKVLEFHADLEKLEQWQNNRDEPLNDEHQQESWNELINLFLPHFEGASLFWLSLLVSLLIIGNFEKIFSRQNFYILLLYLLCPFVLLHWYNLKIAFTGIFSITLLLFLYCLWKSAKKIPNSTYKNINSNKIFWLLVIISILLHIQTIYQKGIGDAGLWSAIGAEYIKETGHLPYGTEFGSNCVYGPLMYVSFIPASLIFSPEITVEQNYIEFGEYQNFEMRGIQTTVLIFDLLTYIAIFLIAHRWGSYQSALVLMILYGFSPYMLGLISEMGIERASHVVGTPLILFSIYFIRKPILSGLLLGWASGMIYYPAFLFPLFFGSISREFGFKKGLIFCTSFALVGLFCLLMIQMMVFPQTSNTSSITAFLDDTLLQQQFKDGYGNSEISFWGQYPSLAQWGKPLVGIAYILFCLAIGFIPSLNKHQFICLTTAVLLGTQLVLSFGGGTYISFYLAPLIITLFCPFQTNYESDVTQNL